MTSSFAQRLFRLSFVVAGAYNLAFGMWAGFWPLHFFDWLSLERPRYPQIWACLGMVVGVYGLLYWYAAWKLDRGRAVIAVGLLGKVLGPIGMVFSLSEDWPDRAGFLCVYNDLIWWLPFSLFLLRGTRFAPWLVASAPWFCALLHALGLAAMGLILSGGTELQPDIESRARFVAGHVASWRVGWALWMASAVSLLGFYSWWGEKCRAGRWGAVAVSVAWIGTVFDLTGEGILTLSVVECARPVLAEGLRGWDPVAFESLQRISTLLTAGVANGLYTAAGIILMLRTGSLVGWVRGLMWVTWAAGAGMTFFAITNSVIGLVVSTAVLFPSFLIWNVALAWSWRKGRAT